MTEGQRAQPAGGFDEAFAAAAFAQISADDGLDDVGHLVGRKRRPDDLARHRRSAERAAVGAAHRDLVPLAAVLVHAQDADVAAVVVAAGIDAAADMQLDVADVVQLVEVVETFGEGRGDGDGARIGQCAQVATRAGDHVGEQADIGRGEAVFARRQPQCAQLALEHPGQHQVLVVRDAQLAAAEAISQCGGTFHLIGRDVARGQAGTLERQRHRAVAGQAVGVHVAPQPALVGRQRVGDGCRHRGGWRRRRQEVVLQPSQFGRGHQHRGRVGQQGLELGIDGVDEALPLGLDQDLDARLEGVVAPTVEVVDAHHGLDEDEDLRPGHEVVHRRGDHRRSPHAAAHGHRETDLAGGVAAQGQADIVPGGGGAVLARTADGDLELARQEGEFRVQRAPLAQQFAVRARVDLLVGGDAGQRVAGDIADAVAAGLDAVHVDFGQQVHDVGGARQRDPVELQVLPRAEVAEAAAFAGQAGVLQVEVACNARQLAQLPAGQPAIGHGHAQHGRMPLHVPAILQAQRAEVAVGQLAGQVALQLVAELGGAGTNESAV